MDKRKPAPLIGGYGSTSGTRERAARSVMEPVMAFGLAAEIERLRGEHEWADGDRNSVTLAKEVDFRVLLSVLRGGARLSEDDGDARVSIHVIDGVVRLDAAGTQPQLTAGALAVIDAGRRWQLTATGDSAVLLTFAWPREKAGV